MHIVLFFIWFIICQLYIFIPIVISKFCIILILPLDVKFIW